LGFGNAVFHTRLALSRRDPSENQSEQNGPYHDEMFSHAITSPLAKPKRRPIAHPEFSVGLLPDHIRVGRMKSASICIRRLCPVIDFG